MKKIVITGANGFIGSALTNAYLKQEDCFVYAIVKGAHNLPSKHKNLCVLELDFLQYGAIPQLIPDGADIFYHFAWDGTFGAKFADYSLQLANARYCGDAIVAASEIGCSKFILAGTMNEYEVLGYFSRENCEPRTTCIYGTAKLAAEMICKTLAYQRGIEFNSTKIAMAYGPGNYSKMIPNVLIDHLNRGISPRLVSGDYPYDWVYIDDIVAAFMVLGVSGGHFRRYYIGHRTQKTFRQIAIDVRDILNPSVKLLFGAYNDSTEIDFALIDTQALYLDTGFECKADFRESILKTAEWVKTLNME